MCRVLTPSLLLLAATVPAEEVLDPQADQLPLVTITATKVPSDPVTVPASVSVVTGTRLIESGATSIDDVAATSAGVHFMNLGTHTTYPVIRGLFGLEADPPTGYYVDGVAQRGLGADQLVDVERVEVLRGPQGTLYGRNSVPGIVNVLTRDPGRDWTGYAILDGAQRNTLGATAAVGGPLHQAVGMRIAARGARSDTVYTNRRADQGEGAPNEDLTLQGKLRWQSMDGDTTVTVSGLMNRFASSGDKFAPIDLALDHRTDNDHEGAFDNSVDNGAITMSRRLGDDLTLTSITGGNRYRNLFDIDLDYTATDGIVFAQETRGHVLSEEVRLSGGQGLRSWVIGVYGLLDRRGTVLDTRAESPFNGFPNPLLPLPITTLSHGDGQLATRNVALFGQAGIPLSDRLTLTVGLRLDYEQQEVRHTSVTSSPTLGGTVLQSFQYADEQSFHAALPKASLSWSWTRSQFSYASVSRGYKGGGYNQTPNVEADIAGGYDPEYATVYELGHRADLLDRRLSLNTAVYHTDYTNKQVVILESPRFYFENAGRARIRGGEVELQAKAAPGLEIFANLGVIHTEITRYDVPVGTGTDLTGKRLSMAPSYDGYLGLQYRHTTGIFLRPDLQLVGDYAADTDNNIIQAPYRKLGLRVGYEWPQAAVYLWGRNLNDAEYLTRGSTTSFPGAQRLVGVGGEPRTLGASAQFEF